jgi:CDP-2,3-bis-(O-geranylgeranyl)-sn-glycerol synthase
MAHDFITLFLLIIIANGTPVFMRFCLKNRLATAIDFGASLPDGQRLFGTSKTWRGLAGAVLITSVASWLLGYSVVIGSTVAVLALLGDLFSSFIKRRLKLNPGSMALFIDQIPESLLPAFILMDQFGLDLMDVLFIVISFFIAELLLSRIFFMLGVRRAPY